MRLDVFLQQKFCLRSRTYSENLIKCGRVSVNDKTVDKPSFDVNESDEVKIESDENFASQGAYKLEKAVEEFSIDLSGLSAIDIGCSNGGFTDCMLRRGAKEVLAVDVAECALIDSVRRDPRVKFLRANARELPQKLTEKFDFCCSDVSFISLKLILGEVFRVLKCGGRAALLVKPQFELSKKALNKKGIVTSEKDRLFALNSVCDFATKLGFEILGKTEAPIRYENKNVEYLIYLEKPM